MKVINNHINQNMEIMKKILEEKKAKTSKTKNTKIAPTYGTQSPGAVKNKK